MKPMQSSEQQAAQDAFLTARAHYLAAKIECSRAQLSTWQLQIAREHYIEAIEQFALACGVLSERDFSSLNEPT
ncbi:MAG: hypothetical protein ABJB74_04010 [Gemmatimonas sp.]